MNYQALRIIAFSITVLVWVVVVAGVVASIFLGIGAVTAVAKVFFLLGGLVLTAIGALMLLGTSKLIYLLIDIEEDLSEIIDIVKEKK